MQRSQVCVLGVQGLCSWVDHGDLLSERAHARLYTIESWLPRVVQALSLLVLLRHLLPWLRAFLF